MTDSFVLCTVAFPLDKKVTHETIYWELVGSIIALAGFECSFHNRMMITIYGLTNAADEKTKDEFCRCLQQAANQISRYDILSLQKMETLG